MIRTTAPWLLALLGLSVAIPESGAADKAPKPAPGFTEQGKKKGRRAPVTPALARAKGVPTAGDKARMPQMGDTFLRQGNFRGAAAAFTKELAANPEAPAAHVGLGRALSRLGRCEEALDHLWPYLDTKPFGDEAALAAATCSQRLGLLEDALYFGELGLALDPDNARLLSQYAVDLDRAGYSARRDAILDQLLLAKADRDASAYARAVIALRHGDLDEFDALMFTWTGEENNRAERSWLEVQAWLDLDDPQEALDELSLVRFGRRGAYTRQLRAEATRRLGDPESALALLETRKAHETQSLDYDMLHARTLVDLGRLKEAEAVMADYDQASHADYFAGQWYLARARGDTRAAAAAALDYERLVDSPLRLLEKLVPVPAR